MWKTIKGFENFYKINEKGEILRINSHKGGLPEEYKVKPQVHYSEGRRPLVVIALYDSEKKSYKNYVLSRLVLETFTGVSGKYVYYKDGNSLNYKLSNLEWSEEKFYNEDRRVQIKCVETNEVYSSVSEAAKKLGIGVHVVYKCCVKGTPYKKLHLTFADEKEKEKRIISPKELESLPKEEWKILEGTKNQYLISNKGRVKSAIRTTPNGLISSEKLVTVKLIDNRPIINTRIYSGKKILRKFFTVSNEVYKAFIKVTDKSVYHKDGNPLNNTIENLKIKKES